MKVAPTIRLNKEERQQLQTIARKGSSPARVQTRARVLLMAAQLESHTKGQPMRRSNSNQAIAELLQLSAKTVSRVRQRFERWFASCAIRPAQNWATGRDRWRSGSEANHVGLFNSSRRAQALDAATAGGPHGRTGVRGAPFRHLGDEAPKKNKLRPWVIKSWCIPQVTTRFIAKMEDVLEVYQRPYDPGYPVICLDEKGKELQSSQAGREPLPAQPDKPGAGSVRRDYEYRRAGSANLWLMCEPLRGWRKVVVSQDRGGRGFAKEIQHLVDVDYPEAEKIVLVTDNLNIHGIWSLYEVFAPAEARRIANKLEWHYTPEHGSWLNMAELELSALARQCLDRRFADEAFLRAECEAWVRERNQREVKIHWQFTAADARIRLRRLYPVIEEII